LKCIGFPQIASRWEPSDQGIFTQLPETAKDAKLFAKKVDHIGPLSLTVFSTFGRSLDTPSLGSSPKPTGTGDAPEPSFFPPAAPTAPADIFP
jgi:hypothetical protein